MPSATKQISINRGRDTALSDRTQTATTSTSRSTGPRTTDQQQQDSPQTTTQVTRAVTRESIESSDPQVTATTEDHAFTLQFTVPLEGAVPCEPPSL